MHGQEFATAVQYDLPIIVVLVDNGMYGTIRMHQENTIPAAFPPPRSRTPTSPTTRAFGGHGERVETSEQFGPASNARWPAASRPFCIA